MNEETKKGAPPIKWVPVKTPSGREVNIRKMKLRDEDLVVDRNLARTGANLDRLLESCTDLSASELDEMLIGDRTYLLIEIRRISKREDYYPKVQCPNCKAEFEDEVELDKLRLQLLNRKGVDDNYEFDMELPSGIKLRARLLRGKDERRLRTVQRDHSGSLLSYLTMMRTVSIEGVDRKTLDWFRELDSDDADHFRTEYEKHDCGYDTTVKTACHSCGQEFSYDLPFDPTFWLGRAKRSR